MSRSRDDENKSLGLVRAVVSTCKARAFRRLIQMAMLKSPVRDWKRLDLDSSRQSSIENPMFLEVVENFPYGRPSGDRAV